MKKILIASDHGGFYLKEFLKTELVKENYSVQDLGTDNLDSCDYPDYAKKLVLELKKDTSQNTLGILVCGTGIGMSMAANRHADIFAAICTNEFMARLTRMHNNANILCLGERVLGTELALNITKTFISTDFEAGRHSKRLALFS